MRLTDDLRDALRCLVDSIETCESCNGSGKDSWANADIACENCGGYGEVISAGCAIDVAIQARIAAQG